MEGVCIFHDKLFGPDQTAAGPLLVPEFLLKLVEEDREIPVGLHTRSQELDRGLFVGRGKDQAPSVPVLELHKLPFYQIEPAAGLPDAQGIDHGHLHLLTA